MVNRDSKFVALSLYSMPADYCRAMEAKLDHDVEFYSISETPKTNILKFLRFFSNLKASKYYLVFDSEESKLLLPILRFIAILSFSSNYYIVTGPAEPVRVSKFWLVCDLFTLFFSFFAGFYYIVRFKTSMLSRIQRGGFAKVENRKTILYLKTNFWFGVKTGGSIGHVAGVVNGFIKNGWRLDYASLDAPVMLDQQVKYLQIISKKMLVLPFEFNNCKLNFEFITHFRKQNFKDKYSFIYQRLSLSNYSGYNLSRRLKIPLVLEYNGSEVWAACNWGKPLILPTLAQDAEDLNLHHADLVVTISEVLREELLNSGVPDEKIVMYPNCIDPTIFNPDRFSQSDRTLLLGRYNIPPDAQVITFVGTFGPWHGAEVLARSIADLTLNDQQFLESRDIYFMMVGSGSRLAAVREIIGKNDRVIYTGLVAQNLAPEYLAASDILVSPHVHNSDGTRFFGSPTKLFEYMAMGKGIIASRLEQIEWILSPSLDSSNLPSFSPEDNSKEMAVFCEPNSHQDLSRAIRFLVERTDWRNKLGGNARAHVLSHYCWSHHVAAIETRLRKLNLIPDN